MWGCLSDLMQTSCFLEVLFCIVSYFLQRYCKASGEQNEKLKDSHFLSRAAAYFIQRYCKVSGEQNEKLKDSHFLCQAGAHII